MGLAVSRKLLEAGHNVTILDNFSKQIHHSETLPSDVADAVKLLRADVRDREALRDAVKGKQCIVHLAAETGTGQSMYQIGHYFDVNVAATASLLDILQGDTGGSIETIVIASSRAIYGEGAYRCRTDGIVYPVTRTTERMHAQLFDPVCPICEEELVPAPTTEDAPFAPSSFYGLTKQVQEQAILLFARTQGLNAFALRYQNVYGPGQSLRNPYTGILAVFSNLARQDQTIEIYEDGLESRDFVYIDDIATATARCVDYGDRFVGPVNVGSGVGTNVLTVARRIAAFFGSQSSISVTGAFRLGDIRHNIADLHRLSSILDIRPATTFEDGLCAFLLWAERQETHDKYAYDRSVSELLQHKLLVRSQRGSA